MKLVLPFHVSKVGAGFPSPATDYVQDDIDLNSHLIKNIPSTFLIRVQGNSMSNIGICNVDLLVVDKSLDQELYVSQKQELDEKKSLLHQSIKILNDREREIIEERKLSENPKTLDELSKKYKISRERIRQIETRAFEKLQKAMLNSSKSKNLLPKN